MAVGFEPERLCRPLLAQSDTLNALTIVRFWGQSGQ